MSIVKLTNINKVYQTSEELEFQALKNVNLKIDKGEFVAITGPSGSGKSTLMNIIGLLDNPSSGSYELKGHDVAHLGENTLADIRNKTIGFVFQSFNLLPRTSALDNVILPMVYSGVSTYERTQRAKAALEHVGLTDKLASTPGQLSGGQQQRVAIARALVTDPEIILADEPTGNLDTKTSLDIMDLLKQLNKTGRTIIIITHELDIAKKARRIIHVRDGQIQLSSRT